MIVSGDFLEFGDMLFFVECLVVVGDVSFCRVLGGCW